MIRDLALPDWRTLKLYHVPDKYQGYIRLVCSIVSANCRASKPQLKWTPTRRGALLKRYRGELGQPLERRTMRHIRRQRSGKYMIRFVVNGRMVYLGKFTGAEAACQAWDNWMRQYLENE